MDGRKWKISTESSGKTSRKPTDQMDHRIGPCPVLIGIFTNLAIQSDLFGMVKWPFKGLSDLQLVDKKVTLNHLEPDNSVAGDLFGMMKTFSPFLKVKWPVT